MGIPEEVFGNAPGVESCFRGVNLEEVTESTRKFHGTFAVL